MELRIQVAGQEPAYAVGRALEELGAALCAGDVEPPKDIGHESRWVSSFGVQVVLTRTGEGDAAGF
jgi:hypothetical protein